MVLFYSRVMGSSATSLPMADKQIIGKGPVLGHDHQMSLCQPVSGQEIKDALFSMDSFKAPGIDGYNVHFNKKNVGIL